MKDLLVREDDMASKPARPAFNPRYDHETMVATILAREAKRNLGTASLRIDDPLGALRERIWRASPMRRP